MKQLSFALKNFYMSILRFGLIGLVLVLGGEVVCGQQIINNGGAITMSGAVTMVVNNASFINNGSFTAGGGTVAFTGTTAYTVGTNNANGSTNFYNLTNNSTNTGTVTLSTVSNTLNVSTGTLACGSATANTLGSPITNLTLLSTSGLTANVSSVGGAITGDVNVQRYIPNKRSWRLITAPVSGYNSIFTTWQIGGNNTANMGMYVSGASANLSSNGMDPSARNTPSLKTWDYTNALFVPITSTKTSNISLPINGTTASNIGYFVFIRGDRNTSFNQYATPTTTTLTSTGALQTGQKTFTASSSITNKYTLVGNPYASPIDFTNVTRTNLVNRFYAWDPLLNTVGGYVLVDDSGNTGTYSVTPYSGTTAQTKILQSGQAFFIQTLSAAVASITFMESCKSSTASNNTGFRPLYPVSPKNINSSIAANLYLLNADSTIIMADGSLTQFNNSYSDSVLVEDAVKFTNINETFGLLRHGVKLALESRPILSVNDTLFLNLSRTSQRLYEFQFVPTNLEGTNLIGTLEDKYLQTKTAISLSNTTSINFKVDTSAASAAADRFQIVFKTLLPFAFTDIVGIKKNRDIDVHWKVANETDIVQYELEKSADGVSFTRIATLSVTGSNNPVNNYTCLDTKAITGDNIYRVKMVSLDGKIKYTSNVVVNMAPLTTGNFIYSNPVKNKQVNLQMNNQAIGIYKLAVTNNSGQLMYTGTVQNNGNNSRFVIQLNNETATGLYNLQITSPTNTVNTQKLIVE